MSPTWITPHRGVPRLTPDGATALVQTRYRPEGRSSKAGIRIPPPSRRTTSSLSPLSCERVRRGQYLVGSSPTARITTLINRTTREGVPRRHGAMEMMPAGASAHRSSPAWLHSIPPEARASHEIRPVSNHRMIRSPPSGLGGANRESPALNRPPLSSRPSGRLEALHSPLTANTWPSCPRATEGRPAIPTSAESPTTRLARLSASIPDLRRWIIASPIPRRGHATSPTEWNDLGRSSPASDAISPRAPRPLGCVR